MALFADKLFLDVQSNILSNIKKNSNTLSTNVLVTASYSSYACNLATRLGWECIASYYDQKSKKYVNVFGKEKIKLVKLYYPPEDYRYNYAISDSKSDKELLAMFQYSELLK